MTELPAEIAAEFGPKSSSVGKQMDRFSEQCSHLQETEAERNIDMGPGHYDICKYDCYPMHGDKVPLSPRPTSRVPFAACFNSVLTPPWSQP